jgi:sarcosine oxidase, subunit gamma
MLKPWMLKLPPATRFILHGNAAVRAAASAAWGISFAETPCRAIVGAGRATLWLGPDEYLLWDSDKRSADVASAEIETVLRGLPHALVDISQRQIALEISGPYSPAIVSGGCPLDLDILKFPIGMCTRSVFAKADIVLWRTAEAAFHMEIWRSFEAYVSTMLHEIGREYPLGHSA